MDHSLEERNTIEIQAITALSEKEENERWLKKWISWSDISSFILLSVSLSSSSLSYFVFFGYFWDMWSFHWRTSLRMNEREWYLVDLWDEILLSIFFSSSHSIRFHCSNPFSLYLQTNISCSFWTKVREMRWLMIFSNHFSINHLIFIFLSSIRWFGIFWRFINHQQRSHWPAHLLQ